MMDISVLPAQTTLTNLRQPGCLGLPCSDHTYKTSTAWMSRFWLLRPHLQTFGSLDVSVLPAQATLTNLRQPGCLGLACSDHTYKPLAAWMSWSCLLRPTFGSLDVLVFTSQATLAYSPLSVWMSPSRLFRSFFVTERLIRSWSIFFKDRRDRRERFNIFA